MTFEEYVTGDRPRYERLAKTVESILKAAIVHSPQLRLQHTQHRAKQAASLERKLKRDGHLSACDIENHVKDLAGCRLVFYTNSDVAAFLSSRIISDNFEVDWNRTKIHHPDAGSDSAAEQFVSNNYVVRLKADRAALPEYSTVAGFWCEVQVQTTLNHAWAEMAHDTIYKKPDLPGGFGASLMESIEKRMADVMRQYLLPAGYEFQKVLNDFERLSTGKELFDRGALEALGQCDDNNARYELLERFNEYILPHYDDITNVFSEILATTKETVIGARQSPSKSIETPFGSYPGHTALDIVDQIIVTLDRLKYVDVQSTFDFLIEMFVTADEREEKSRWIRFAQGIAKHDIPAWQKVGPGVQLALLGRIKALPKDVKQASRPLLVAVLQAILETELTGTTAHFDKVVFSRGPVPFNDTVRAMRRDAVRLLKLFAMTASGDAELDEAISALQGATRVGEARDENFQAEITENSVDVVHFYGRLVNKISYASLESLEHRMLWLYRHTPESIAAETEPTNLNRGRLELREAIRRFRDQINSDSRFVTYKTLVGFDSVFPPAWEDREFDISGIDAYRTQRIDEFVATVSDENADEWLEIIRACASTRSDDLATFPKFGEFLQKLAEAKPAMALHFLKDETDLLANFLPSIARGLEGHSIHGELVALMNEWVAEGRFISSVIWSFRSTESVDVELLERSLAAAVKHEDRHALFNLITVADLRNGDVDGGLIDSLLIPTIKVLTAFGEYRWPNAAWGRRSASPFGALTQSQADDVLEAMATVPRLDWKEEEILSAIATSRPRSVVDFFGKRLALKQESKTDYDAIPFQFFSLHEQLVEEHSYTIARAHDWFEVDPRLFAYRGGRFVANVFGNAWDSLETELRTFLDGEREDLNFVVQILRTFEGQEFLHPLIRDVVDRLELDSDLAGEIDVVLNESGVISGEFGLVELHKIRRAQMMVWLEDERPRVRAFAERHIRLLERMISGEQRRAEEDYELRKRNWGTDEEVDEG